MDLTKALAPAFACGVALQQLLELLDPILSRLFSDPLKKKTATSIISLVVGVLFAAAAKITVLKDLGFTGPMLLDVVVSALIVSAGTEGFNSIVKFAFYKKEEQKVDAAEKRDTAADVTTLNRGAAGGPTFPLGFSEAPVLPS